MKNGEEMHSTPQEASGNHHSRSRSEELTAALIMMENSEERRGNVKGRSEAEEVSLRRKVSSKSDLATAVCERGHSVSSAWEVGPRVKGGVNSNLFKNSQVGSTCT